MAIWDNSWKVALLTITGGELRLPNLGYYLQALIDNGTIGGPIILTKSTSRGPRTRFGGRLFLQTAAPPPLRTLPNLFTELQRRHPHVAMEVRGEGTLIAEAVFEGHVDDRDLRIR